MLKKLKGLIGLALDIRSLLEHLMYVCGTDLLL